MDQTPRPGKFRHCETGEAQKNKIVLCDKMPFKIQDIREETDSTYSKRERNTSNV